MNPKKLGHARSTAVHVSKHGKSIVYALPIAGRFGLRAAASVDSGVSAENTFCGAEGLFLSLGCSALSPVALGVGGDLVKLSGFAGLGSPHRVKVIVQSHFLYSRWQSLHPTRGEYQSRPHANVVRVVVKFVRYERSGVVISAGRLSAVYILEPAAGGGGSGTV